MMPSSRGSHPSLEDIPREGDLIAGKYRVERVLGQGGMGVVVAARHMSLRQRVAVKFLLAEATRLPGASERFLREAQSAVAIQSEHVARVIDVGTLDTGSPYMVMEYLDGADLSKVSRSYGPLPTEMAVDYILQAGEAIAEAHALGIVHRDLKPGNMFLVTRPDGSSLVKVLDFGLSKAMNADSPGAGDASLTATHVVVGSPYYMSPEQMRSLKYVDARTDVWALGVILFQLLTARRPFEGDSLAAVLACVAADQPLSLRAFRPDVPAELEAVVMRCLEKDLSRRVQSVSELARMLEPFAPASSRLSVDRAVRLLPESGAAPRRAAGSMGTILLQRERTSESAAPASRQGVGSAQDPTTNLASAWGLRPAAPKHRRAVVIAGAVTCAAVVFSVLIVIRVRFAGEPEAAAEQGSAAASVASEQTVGAAPEQAGATTALSSSSMETARTAPPPAPSQAAVAVDRAPAGSATPESAADKLSPKRPKGKASSQESGGEARAPSAKSVVKSPRPPPPTDSDPMDKW